ncbi:MAG: Ig-like domain-containing protein [Gemmatimonadaceae bacterium]
MRGAVIAVGLFVVAAAGCHTAETFTATSTQDCSTDIVGKFSPTDTTISVGATYTQKITVTTCSGTRTLVDTYAWSSNNPSKVSVDPITGVVTGVAVGTATLTAIGSFYGSFLGGTVTVK